MNNDNAQNAADTPKSEPLYTAFVNVRNTELSVYWTRYNIQSAINFVLLAAVLTSRSDSFVNKYMNSAAIAGFVLAGIWFLVTIKGKQLLTDRWDSHLRTYEKIIIGREEHRLFCKVAQDEEKKCKLMRMWDNLDILARGLPVLCMLVWGLVWVRSCTT